MSIPPIFIIFLNFRYVESLVAYLSDYLYRIQPLFNQEAMLVEVKSEFEEKFIQGVFLGWRVSGVYL